MVLDLSVKCAYISFLVNLVLKFECKMIQYQKPDLGVKQ